MQILVIDDETALRQILAAAISQGGYAVEQAASCAEARAKLADSNFDVALCDIHLPDGNGIELVRESRADGIETAFIVVTGFGSMESAVEALRAGADDYVTKPVLNEELLHRIAQIEKLGKLRDENRTLKRAAMASGPRLFHFRSPQMLQVERLVLKVAPTVSTVLITGESGTGKGVVARMIHDCSTRRDAPFLSVNCSAIPEQLMEAEFFGHTKGAFTSASASRKGLLLQAETGTLFLDEIGELPLHMQSKLLNVIEDKEVRPVGSELSRRVDTRIIAATNRNLQEMAARGGFREDLYFRLSMFEIAIPPLRARPQDIRDYLTFLLQNTAGGGTGPVRIDPFAEDVLLQYAWPGNVRELENVINRAMILAETDGITLGDLPSAIVSPRPNSNGTGTKAVAAISAEGTLRERMRRFEAEVLLQALDEADGDRKAVAQKLGIALSSLYRKLDNLGN